MAGLNDKGYPRITQMDYNDFHSVDRSLYAALVYDLWRDPVDAIQMMAIWIWLERVVMVCPDLTRKILSLPSHQLINKVANEALFCWACIDDVRLLFSASANDFPLTNVLLKKDMPVEIFRTTRESSIAGINDVINRVCANCFKDIWDGAMAARKAQMDFLRQPATSSSSSNNNNNNHYDLEVVAPKKVDQIKPADERTLFVTFSKGYPVTEWEVREFFTRLYGDCIESFYMQEVGEGEHALFAKIVLCDASYLHEVLSGDESKAKFNINGKHVWMRRFIPKRK